MNFDELWEHQQGAIFLKKDHIYDNRKDLAEFFFWHGNKYANAKIKELEAKLSIAVGALELLEKYRAYNGDDWVSVESRQALEKLRGEG